MLTITNTGNEIMIYRNNKLDTKYLARRIFRQSGRVLSHYTYKVLVSTINGTDELVREFNKIKR